MKETEGQGRALDKEQYPPVAESPAEKLEDKPPASGSLIPGAESAESEEVKKEVNPNTE